MAIIDDSQLSNWGIARTQSPTNKNYALKWSTFETIVVVNQPEVQWASLILEEPPSWSWLPPSQVSMLCQGNTWDTIGWVQKDQAESIAQKS